MGEGVPIVPLTSIEIVSGTNICIDCKVKAVELENVLIRFLNKWAKIVLFPVYLLGIKGGH